MTKDYTALHKSFDRSLNAYFIALRSESLFLVRNTLSVHQALLLNLTVYNKLGWLELEGLWANHWEYGQLRTCLQLRCSELHPSSQPLPVWDMSRRIFRYCSLSLCSRTRYGHTSHGSRNMVLMGLQILQKKKTISKFKTFYKYRYYYKFIARL